MKNYKQPKRYYRYPLLHRGDTKEKKETIEQFLSGNEFTVVPVSIDNDEYVFNRNFVDAYKEGDDFRAYDIGDDYVKHMIERQNYYSKMAVDKHGEDVKHILLLHMNLINSYYLDNLLKWYEDNDWEFITVEEALEDPLYSKPDNYIGKRGISYLERVYGFAE